MMEQERKTRKNILLVSPDFDIESFWISDEDGAGTEVMNDVTPVGLATVAAMIPETYKVDIWDEVVHGRIGVKTVLARSYDLVGITGYNVHYFRCVEIADIFRKKGALVVVGGPGVSGMPERYLEHFDVRFIGEAERTWPKFLRDWENGSYKSEYRQIEKIDLVESPLPAWDKMALDMTKYAMGGVQTTRGCPFDCEFCDVIYLYGRKVRHKPIENVIEEVRTLERLGVKNVIFCDDEFIGDPRYTKALLRNLREVNNSFKRPLTYMTQVSMNLSRDEEILELFADSNFGLVFIGVETPNRDSLKEAGKYQNLRKNLAEDVRKILSYGIAIRAGMIVGFDHDTPGVFDLQDDFVHSTCLPSVTLSMLKAIPGTRLWRRLRREGRVLDITRIKGDSKSGNAFKPRSYTNIIPKAMTRKQLMEGYRKLAERLYSWESFSDRIRGFVSNVKRRPNVLEPMLSDEEMESLRQIGLSGPDAGRAVDEIVTHIQQAAPYMMRKVRMLTLQHARHKKTFDRLLPYIDRLVEYESSGKVQFDKDDRPVPIPETFRKEFLRDRLFEDMHRYVFENLEDKDRVPEALTEIFVDFLTRLGDVFKDFEPQHRTFLQDLSDRTCQKLNREMSGSPGPGKSRIMKLPDVKRSRLAEDILRAIEQDLLKEGAPAT